MCHEIPVVKVVHRVKDVRLPIRGYDLFPYMNSY